MGPVPHEMQWACWTSSEPGVRFWTDTGSTAWTSDLNRAAEVLVAKQEPEDHDAEALQLDEEDQPQEAATDEDVLPELILPLLDEDLVPLHLLHLRTLIIAEEQDTRPRCRWCDERQRGHGRGWCRNRQCRQWERSWRRHMKKLRRSWRARHFMRRRGPMPKLRAVPDDILQQLARIPADGTYGSR